MTEKHETVILFDGVCNLCNNAVQFVINNDPRSYFKFSSLQSDFGQKVLKDHGMNLKEYSTFLLLENGVLYKKSAAALRAARHLKVPFNFLYFFIIVPYFIRDLVYDIVSKYRYSWFGKKDKCMLPSPELKNRFID